ncbi:hypothetical protein ACJ73_04749 [Blastomyces percursus]|uniref:Uncharacterized protein n=1 Tax=Blastomyces percursus TaxID=1658174 RepID=A0A1J9Q5Y7_9EURO|nr:hypothetical protein ACJ73_04749 [Blastomyces percursus]
MPGPNNKDDEEFDLEQNPNLREGWWEKLKGGGEDGSGRKLSERLDYLFAANPTLRGHLQIVCPLPVTAKLFAFRRENRGQTWHVTPMLGPIHSLPLAGLADLVSVCLRQDAKLANIYAESSKLPALVGIRRGTRPVRVTRSPQRSIPVP